MNVKERNLQQETLSYPLLHLLKDRRIKSDRVINYFYLETKHAFVSGFSHFFLPTVRRFFYFKQRRRRWSSWTHPSSQTTFSSTPEASVVRRPRKMVARSGTSLIFHFVAYRYRGAAPRRCAPGHRYSLQASIQGERKGGGRERPRERAREKKERQI